MSDVRLVVFDMDGVLFDSEPVWQQVRKQLVAANGGTWTEQDGLDCRGAPAELWARRVSERTDGRVSPVEAEDGVIRGMREAYARDLPLFPGAVEAVRDVAGDHMVAVASGSPRVLIDTVLEHSGLGRWCAAAACGEEVANGKPAPDVYLRVLDELHVEATATVGVEDSPAGLQSLIAAGIRPIAVADPATRFDASLEEHLAARVRAVSEVSPELIARIA